MNYFLGLLKNLDKLIFLIIAVLATISIVMISSTAYKDGFVINRDIIIQGVAYILGSVAIVLMLMTDYKSYAHFEKFLYGFSIAFLLLVYVPGLGVESFGARSWIQIPHVTTIQPSEFVKISFIILMAKYLSDKRDSLYTFNGVFKAFLYTTQNPLN